MNIPDSVNVALVAIAGLISMLFVPLITNLLTAKQASGAVKQAVAGGLALTVAILALVASNSFDLTNISATIIAVFWTAKAGYEIFKKIIDPVHDVGLSIGQ